MFGYYMDFKTEERLCKIVSFLCGKNEKLFQKIWDKVPGTTWKRLEDCHKATLAERQAAYERGEEPVEYD